MLTRITGVSAAVVLVASLVIAAFELGAARGDAQQLPDDFEALAEVYDRVHDEAVTVPSDEQLVEGAIEGMLESLDDEYAAYYDAREYRALTRQLDGRFVGVGVVLDSSGEGLVVQSVLADSPAERAGVRPGARIVAVDGQDVRDLADALVIDRVRGEEGTTVELGLQHEAGSVRDVALTRVQIVLPNVEARLLDGDLGYVQLRQFSADAADRAAEVVRDLRAQGARGFVLDLRGNPGGRLPVAVDVVGLFVGDGEVVRVGDDLASALAFRTAGNPLAPDAPLVVLVDEGSASASEIVAAAVQDLDRGTVVGATTYGKGTVQTVQRLPDGQGFKFTTDRYFSPSGDSIDGVGVRPDRVVSTSPGAPGGADRQLDVAAQELAQRLAHTPG